MELDIVIVTYNSEKWILNCIKSLAHNTFNTKKLNIIFVDNSSSDSSVSVIKEVKELYGEIFGRIEIVVNKKNKGFGTACNIGAKQGKASYIFFLNVDTEISNNSLVNLEKDILTSSINVAAWEMRQFPFEHPKYYDPVTQFTSWVSGAAVVIKREAFNKVRGFDESIFLYAEDVDLSWRIAAEGYNLKYVPDAIVVHYSYLDNTLIKPAQYINSIVNNLNLRLKYGGLKDIMYFYYKVLGIFLTKQPFPKARKRLIWALLLNLSKSVLFSLRRFTYRKKIKTQFIGWDYEVERTGAYYNNEIPNQILSVQVSILIRTIGRVDALREALISVRNQTYKNIEVVIIEDGKNISKDFLMREFPDLNIVYHCTEEKVGRSKAANMAMDLASGEYLNFLDDDDLFFADHVETLLKELLRTQASVAYTVAFEVPTEFLGGYAEKVNRGYNIVHRSNFNRLRLFYENYLPIQTVMFKKEIIKENSLYMDETLDALEDWDFWMRLSLKSDFLFVDKTTSYYRIPYNKNEQKNRQKVLDQALSIVREKQKKYSFNLNVYEAYQNILEIKSQNKINNLKQKYKLLYKFYSIIRK